jgi:ketosteroid isomerase-like protein
VIATVLSEFSEFESSVEEILGAGDDVVVISFQRGVGRASGAAVEKRLPQVWTVRDGKAVHWRILRDRNDALRTAGLSSEAS